MNRDARTRPSGPHVAGLLNKTRRQGPKTGIGKLYKSVLTPKQREWKKRRDAGPGQPRIIGHAPVIDEPYGTRTIEFSSAFPQVRRTPQHTQAIDALLENFLVGSNGPRFRSAIKHGPTQLFGCHISALYPVKYPVNS